jgi:hypothetical protein
METFTIISGIASILSLLVSLFIAKSVMNINKDSVSNVSQNVTGNSNKQAGRDNN